jgi:hypothetical protein
VWREPSWPSRPLSRSRCSSKLIFLYFEGSGGDEGPASSRTTILRSQDPGPCLRQTGGFLHGVGDNRRVVCPAPLGHNAKHPHVR